MLGSGLGFHGNRQLPSTVCSSLDQLTDIGPGALGQRHRMGGGSMRPSINILEKRSTSPSMDILEMTALGNFSPHCGMEWTFPGVPGILFPLAAEWTLPSIRSVTTSRWSQGPGGRTFLVNSTQHYTDSDPCFLDLLHTSS